MNLQMFCSGNSSAQYNAYGIYWDADIPHPGFYGKVVIILWRKKYPPVKTGEF